MKVEDIKVGDRLEQVKYVKVDDSPYVTVTGIENNGRSIRHIHEGAHSSFTCSPDCFIPAKINNWRKILEK